MNAIFSHGKHGKHGRKSGKPERCPKIISAEYQPVVKWVMIYEDLTFKIRGAIFQVFAELGPGLLESVYEKALMLELKNMGLLVTRQIPVRVIYKGEDLDLGFRVDLLVEEQVIIEIKSVDAIHDVHKKQLLTYLKLTGMRLGILVNFNSSFIRDNSSLFRIAN